MDFTSALYLGMRHGSRELAGWDALTAGVPAALAAPPGEESLARRLAALQGCGAAALFPSTLHLFWDLFGALAPGASEVWVDAGAYPVARWGAARARVRGVPVRVFPHHDPGALRRALARRGRGAGGRPVVLADGFCPGCGRPAPLAEYLAAVRGRGGTLVVDDTQALGIFGREPGPRAPYGSGGGGSLRRLGIGGPEVLVGASLAKAFGAPLAVLAGSRDRVREVAERSGTRVHCSPPSAAALLAAERALRLNRERGDALRAALAERVRRFRRGLAAAGAGAAGGRFPVQTLRPTPGTGPAALHGRLEAEGIRPLLLRGEDGAPAVAFVINATHTLEQIDRAVAAVARAVGPLPARSRRCQIEATPGTAA